MDLATAERLSLSADPNGLSALKKDSNDPAVAKAVAGQFGALLMQGLMRGSDGEAVPMAGSGVGGNIVSALFANTISQAAMSGDKLGLADILFRSIEAKQHGQESQAGAAAVRTPRPDTASPTDGLPLSPYWQSNGLRPPSANVTRARFEPPGKAGQVAASSQSSPTAGWGPWPLAATRAATPDDANVSAGSSLPASSAQIQSFAQQLRPLLQEAGRQLSVSPRILLAQAALETGWGRSVVGNNVFGIKAGASWQGSQVTTMTHEVEAGQMVLRQASFRAYPSLDAAVQDYVALVGGSRRYQAAVGAGNDAAAYAQGLVAGGYASDNEYARKLTAIAAGPSVDAAFAATSQPTPLNLLAGGV